MQSLNSLNPSRAPSYSAPGASSDWACACLSIEAQEDRLKPLVLAGWDPAQPLEDHKEDSQACQQGTRRRGCGHVAEHRAQAVRARAQQPSRFYGFARIDARPRARAADLARDSPL